jgi:hypothetical protein
MTDSKQKIISLHQPDFLPYSGFWYKLANSDVMDLRTSVQIVKSPGYQRRVKMRDKWVAVPLAEGQSLKVPIDEVRIRQEEAERSLVNVIRGRYNNAPCRKEHLDPLCDAVVEAARSTDLLWEFNFALLQYLRGVLGIATPFRITGGTEAGKGAGVLEVLQRYPDCEVYLSGTGAKKYMSDTAMFEEAGIRVEWSKHAPMTGDSILTVLMDCQDPMDFILAEKEEGEAA